MAGGGSGLVGVIVKMHKWIKKKVGGIRWGQGGCERRISQDGCERRIEVIVKMQKSVCGEGGGGGVWGLGWM